MLTIIKNPPSEQWNDLMSRPYAENNDVPEVVKRIFDRVRKDGDKALIALAEKYDKVKLDTLFVEQREIENAQGLIDEDLKKSILIAKENIEKFHVAQQEGPLIVETMPGVKCQRRSVAIEKVGLYVPGGSAPLFSTLLMLGIPAKIAGCKEIIVATPSDQKGEINPVIRYVAHILGIEKILRLGGAQAIAALALGTESLDKVNKIFGPGNQYVTGAKQFASQSNVAIDMPAGPSEVAVMVDESSIASFVAIDLLSQAEHGADSQVILVSNEQNKVDEINRELMKIVDDLPRKSIALEALKNSKAFVFENMEKCIQLINAYGPEHLIISVQDDEAVAGKIINAGSVFLGNYTPESVGDYASGTNHTLPTNGWAKAYSGVSLDSFLKKITYQKLTAEGLLLLGPVVEKMAQAENLEAHKRAVSIRLKYLNETN
ncbi:MAG TPA: histidinol dehydrogenase [Cyclobacteriaceae bacterium]